MYKPSSIYSLFFVIFAIFSGANAWTKTTEPSLSNNFYMAKICTSLVTRYDNEYCDDGYILQSETLKNGRTKETIVMEGMGGYGWEHTSLNKIDADTYHVYLGCGSPCGANMLFGRGGEQQDFDLYFDVDAKSRCTVEYISDKHVWVARRFFTDKAIVLPSTKGVSESAMYPKYSVEFDSKGRLEIKNLFEDKVVQTLPNPCVKHLK